VEGLPIHVGFKQQGRYARRKDPPAQIIVNLDGDRERAMAATRLDADPQFLSPEASLHEGRG
jgi:hypothetical protein